MDENLRQINQKRLDALENIIENHARTERHVEKFADWNSDEANSATIKKQKKREENIKNLENAILTRDH